MMNACGIHEHIIRHICKDPLRPALSSLRAQVLLQAAASIPTPKAALLAASPPPLPSLLRGPYPFRNPINCFRIIENKTQHSCCLPAADGVAQNSTTKVESLVHLPFQLQYIETSKSHVLWSLIQIPHIGTVQNIPNIQNI